MPTYRRETRIEAPLSDVWEFHSTAAGLDALTPGFANLRIEGIRGPDGESRSTDDVLPAGAEIDASVRPFGVGPRQRWTSVIVSRREDDGAAQFRDEMRDGPFRKWRHTHSFFADDGATILRDRVAYRLPLDGLGDAVGPLAVIGLDPTFRYRHRKTKELLEQ